MTASPVAGTPPGRLYNVPPLPRHYLERVEHLDALKELVLGGGRAVGITAPSKKVSVQGMGGIGKSVLAAALAHDDEIRAAFPDGVIWVPLGQKPELELAQAQVATVFEDGFPEILSPRQGKSRPRC